MSSAACVGTRDCAVASRELEIDPADRPALDPRRVLLGNLREPAPPDTNSDSPRDVCWQGAVLGDGRLLRSYFVALYQDGTGSCSCPDFHFRGVLKADLRYACKHMRRAQAQHLTASE